MTSFLFLLIAFWNPFAAKIPSCNGVKAACVALARPAFQVATGTVRPIAAVYYKGKSIPFMLSDDKTLGPGAVVIPLNKADYQPERLVLKYAPAGAFSTPASSTSTAVAAKKAQSATQAMDAHMRPPNSTESSSQ